MYKNNFFFISCNEDAVTIVDVSNKSNPIMLSRLEYEGSSYTHQGWLDENHDYFVFGDELDEQGGYFSWGTGTRTKTLVVEVFDLMNPRLVGTYLGPTNATDHNQYIIGTYIYQANFRAGLRILRINQMSKANFTEVAYFDIYPEDDDAQLNGAWGVYPYFPSGTILVSGMEQGLYILKWKDRKPVTPTMPAQPPVVVPVAVIPTPVFVPTTPSKPVSSPSPSPSCFSGDNMVHVQDVGLIPMNRLQIGDYVKTSSTDDDDDDTFTQVYGFGHLDRHQVATFLVITFDCNNGSNLVVNQTAFIDHCASSPSYIEISAQHLIRVEKKQTNHHAHHQSEYYFIPAADIRVGDLLSQQRVISIHEVERYGVYAPLTQSGIIAVNGIVASNYVNLLDFVPVQFWDQHTIGHIVYSGQRLFCYYFLTTCQNESYIKGYGVFTYGIVASTTILNQYYRTIFVQSYQFPDLIFWIGLLPFIIVKTRNSF
jgi:Hint module/LVIVD repeat